MRLVLDLESQMKAAAKNLEFEKAALIRDQVVELSRELAGDDEGIAFLTGRRVPTRPREEENLVSLGSTHRSNRSVRGRRRYGP